MPVTIINPCAGDIIDPVCDPCLGGVEHGRIRGGAFINKAYLPTVQDAIDDLMTALNAVPVVPATVTAAKVILDTAIADGITSKVIYIIPETTGTFDGGAPVEGPGYGDRTSRFIGFNFGLAYKDPSFQSNTDFYNTISLSTGWHFLWRTETLTRISNNPVTIVHKSPVQEDLNSEVVWEVEIKWNGKNQPKPYKEMIDYFVCPN
jgi:hypothetical protein